ncbi:glycosyltransferase [Pontibacter sp. KCTC 32443]|uniref:glycosyltransferase n=1 Tax=Pontibacter TaxID=323449 RepID=UPI00164E82D3|nr:MULTISPECIES: glycosyltransferase [Pontibacter]MBC5773719.1 glycosyltransferase [Pontibacter sp. KCTC 32443]
MTNYLIYTTLTAWREPPRSRHQVSGCLQKKGVVYFVEKSKIGLPKIVLTTTDDNLVLITPYFPVDYRIRYRTPLVNELYHYWLLSEIRKLYIEFEMVITFDHTSHIITKFYPDVVYYCGDDFIGNSEFSFYPINLFHSIIEQKLASKAKMCIVTSDYLLSRHIKYNKRTYLVPLGAPSVEYDKIYKPSHLKKPVLGLVAYLNFKIPLDVLDQLVLEYKIYLIGPAAKNIKERYKHHRNAIFTGPKEGTDLYQLLQNNVDVCIAPYAEERINKGVTPNKMWLYLALGKPCVVTEIPNIRNLELGEKLVYKCSNQNFSSTCHKAFDENNETLFQLRIQKANDNSWSQRVESILNYFQTTEKSVQANVL